MRMRKLAMTLSQLPRHPLLLLPPRQLEKHPLVPRPLRLQPLEEGQNVLAHSWQLRHSSADALHHWWAPHVKPVVPHGDVVHGDTLSRLLVDVLVRPVAFETQHVRDANPRQTRVLA